MVACDEKDHLERVYRVIRHEVNPYWEEMIVYCCCSVGKYVGNVTFVCLEQVLCAISVNRRLFCIDHMAECCSAKLWRLKNKHNQSHCLSVSSICPIRSVPIDRATFVDDSAM